MLSNVSKLLPLALTAVALHAGSAQAFFDAELMYGKRWYAMEGADDKTHGVQSQEIQVAAHISPIPLVPVSIGALINMGTLKTADFGPDVSDAKVFQAGVDVMAWIPMVPFVTPFARLTVPLVSTMALKYKVDTDVPNVQQNVVETDKLSGYHLDVGAKIPVLPLINVLVEVGMASETSKADEVKLDGAKQSDLDTKAYKAGSQSFTVGVEVGI